MEKIDEKMRDWQEVYRKSREDFLKQHDVVMMEGSLDEDGYPTEHALKLIEIWDWNNPVGWFSYIKSIWHLSSWGWHEIEGGKDDWTDKELSPKILRYHISTAGWSGNESIISAMQNNHSLWFHHWVQSRRGGHYIFELDQEEEEENEQQN